jgi:hypothetical protein
MTAEEWKNAEKALSTIFGSVKMMADGYEISVHYSYDKPGKYVLMVYVNGYVKGEWIVKDCEIRRKFYSCRKKSLISKTKFIKECGKRAYDRCVKENPDMLYYTYYTPYFDSFRTLKSHFIKNNQSIELIEAIC